ncbi:bifunctional protein HldE [Microtetraspora sp. NBRC 13810]|uniref:PfkB family carbohydrate kinase n=1 Tax=Microtetraspora sp. NBRC 13810 TaxID=3030990 RepID=UPI0024A53F9B|nr:PfkB family carbohydrate kinase [Microtetraspora sp. NBRC 13810]GLW11424.1 bifunctional protein HldE [Microtetraspora sp. NBRC 13810]
MTRTGPVVVIGDTLLDVDVVGEAERLAPDAPVPVVVSRAEHRRPGGAGLAALLAARDGAEVVLITAVGDDPAGRFLRGLLTEHVHLVRLPLSGSTVSKTRIRARGQTLVRLDGGDGRAVHPAGAGRPDGTPDAEIDAVLRDAGGVLVSDYGHGTAGVLLGRLHDLDVSLVWDPHPRGPAPPPDCTLVTPSESEARALCGESYTTPDLAARRLVRTLGAGAVAITLGEDGAVLARRGGRSVRMPAPQCSAVSDVCGAGDRFAGAAALALRDGAPVEDAVAVGVGEASRFVRTGGAAAIRVPVPVLGDGPRTAQEVADAVRAAGGRLVATGGCFDLLHAGHVSLLRGARALGDALIVCVNTDASVRRLKGPGRPVVAERDRVAMLSALECVDAVLLFEEASPCAAIARLRPDVWVKGADHAGGDLPEAEVVRRGGGEIVTLPRVPGRSTTELICAAHAAARIVSTGSTGETT